MKSQSQRESVHARLAACPDFDVTRGQYANLCISNADSDELVINSYASIGDDADKVYAHLIEALRSTSAARKVARGHARVSMPYASVVFPDVAFAAPLIRSKKLFLRPMLRELLWFLRGDTNIEYLKRFNVNIWDGWVDPATAKYEWLTGAERVRILHKENKHVGWDAILAKHPDDLEAQSAWLDSCGIPTHRLVAGELGPVYGAQWRRAEDVVITKSHSTGTDEVNKLSALGYNVVGTSSEGTLIMRAFKDQLGTALNLLQNDPGSSRMLVNAWHPGQTDHMRLPPCHFAFQFVVGRHVKAAMRVPFASEQCLSHARTISRDRIADDIENETPYLHLDVVQRSVDTLLGLPFNWASYSTMLMLVSEITGIRAGSLNYSMHDVHFYENQNQNDELLTVINQNRKLRSRAHDQNFTLEQVHAQVPRIKIVLPESVQAQYAADPTMSYKDKLDVFLSEVMDLPDDKLFEVFQYNYVDPMPEVKFPVSV